MKSTLICGGMLALAASFGAHASANPTEDCIDALSAIPALQPVADKVALSRSTQARAVRVADRTPTAQERDALALWLMKRNDCFDAGAAQRRAAATPQQIAYTRSVFVFQQRLVADLQAGRMTYAEFNRRRAELATAAGEEI
jgi:hypothetical protein